MSVVPFVPPAPQPHEADDEVDESPAFDLEEQSFDLACDLRGLHKLARRLGRYHNDGFVEDRHKETANRLLGAYLVEGASYIGYALPAQRDAFSDILSRLS
jgi:hypothetical protein